MRNNGPTPERNWPARLLRRRIEPKKRYACELRDTEKATDVAPVETRTRGHADAANSSLTSFLKAA